MTPFTEISDESARVRKSKFEIVPVLNTVISSTVLLVILCIFGMAVALYSDAQDTLKDLNELLPEVSSTLRMVSNICKAPEYERYCSADS